MENYKWQLNIKVGDQMLNLRTNEMLEITDFLDIKEEIKFNADILSDRLKEINGKIYKTPISMEKIAKEIFDELPPAKRDMMQNVRCSFCHGGCWDNREGKRNPKAPDFKCRDKNCAGAAWIDRKTGDLNWKK